MYSGREMWIADAAARQTAAPTGSQRSRANRRSRTQSQNASTFHSTSIGNRKTMLCLAKKPSAKTTWDAAAQTGLCLACTRETVTHTAALTVMTSIRAERAKYDV